MPPTPAVPPLHPPLAGSKFTLNSAAVAGFFGGKEAISAMATVHLCEGRRWLGWFNSPGSYTVAKRFGRMANSRFWDGLFPGPNDSPAVSFGLDGKKGPEYIGALSGTAMPTGHLAYLTMERSKELRAEKIDGRTTTPINVSYLAMKHVNYKTPVKRQPLMDALLGLIPIIISVVTCLMCALVWDWYCFNMILLGIISSGYASLVIGNGRLVIKSVTKPAKGAPPGHGILKGDGEVVVIKGEERDVNAITKGRFDLVTDSKRIHGEKGTTRNNPAVSSTQVDEEKGTIRNSPPTPPDEEKGTTRNIPASSSTQADEEEGMTGNNPATSSTQLDEEKGTTCDDPGKCSTEAEEEEVTPSNYHEIGVCSLLLTLQFLLQLLLIPQGSLFGQIMFVVSLGASWAYNSYLSSLEKEKIQTELLFQTLENPEMHRFRAGTRTTMAVFVCLLLFHGVESTSPEEDRACRVKILQSCLKNDTAVWRRWTDKVVRQLLDISEELPYLEEDDEDRAFSGGQKALLDQLLQDATDAFNGYFRVRERLP